MTSLAAAWDQLRRQPLFAAMAVLVTVSSLLSGVAGLIAVDAQRDTKAQARALAAEVEAREVSLCERGNESRAVIRNVARDVAIEGGEALIELVDGADNPPDPAVIAEYRGILNRRLDAVVAQLDDRDCDAEAAARRRAARDTG